MKLLFIDINSSNSLIAETFWQNIINDDTEITSAGIVENVVNPNAIKVMKEIGLNISNSKPYPILAFKHSNFDIVISLSDKAQEFCSSLIISNYNINSSKNQKKHYFIGAPIHIFWDIPLSLDNNETIASFRKIRDDIKKHILDIYNNNYLKAFKEYNRRFEHLVDLLEDGIIAHDDNRFIFLFNKEAERITGLSRNQVIGHDCHKIFPPEGLCSSKCRFKNSPSTATGKQEYQIFFKDPNGNRKQLKVSALPFQLKKGKPTGTLTVIRDVTEINSLHQKLEKKFLFHNMIGVSENVQKVFETIKLVATSEYPVIIFGESGTGKELTARAIHRESQRKDAPFVPINCGALPENILESELFGHVKGAFTGAIRDKKGRFELANHGTLFLDEVGELSPAFQVRLLRVLQEKQIVRVGGEKTVNVDVRIISASNKNLKIMIDDGTFREDLFYRLCVVPVNLPPLRERFEAIPFLVEYILKNIQKETKTNKIYSISKEAMNFLQNYSWPGNIRELKNVLQYASIYCKNEEILKEHLPFEIITKQLSKIKTATEQNNQINETIKNKKKGKLDLSSVKNALIVTKGNKVKAAKLLKVGRATLYRFLDSNPNI